MVADDTYVFQESPSELFLLDGYERVGLVRSAVGRQKIQAAIRSLNFIVQSWANRTLPLFTVKQAQLWLNGNQNFYTLDEVAPGIIDILEAVIRVSQRNNIGGTAFVGAGDGGIAANAFDGNPLTACTQTVPNGTIGYQWTTPLVITLVGVQSFVDADLTLTFSYSTDGTTYYPALTSTKSTFCAAGKITWFTMITPQSGTYFEVTETGGATLNLAELYFNTNVTDTLITRMSRSEYITYGNKSFPSVGRSSQYWLDRQVDPVLYIYPAPYVYFNCMFFTYKQQIPDIISMLDRAKIPARFMEALCAELAVALAIKEAKDPGMIGILQQHAKTEYDLARDEDRERVPLRMYGDFTQGWTSQ